MRTDLAELASKHMPSDSYIDAYDTAQEKYLAVLEKICHRFWTKRELIPIKKDLLHAKGLIGAVDCKEPYLQIKKALKRIT